MRDSDVKHVVVASESGKTALRVAMELRDLDVSVICVSGYAGIIRVGVVYGLTSRAKRKKNWRALK